MVFHSRETTALIWVWFLHTLPQTHPLSPSLSLRASAFLAFLCSCDICPTQLDLMRATAWSMRSESERTARKSEGEREREKQRALLFPPTTGSWRSSRLTKRSPTPATNRSGRRQRITRTPCVPYSHLPALIPSSSFFSTFALRFVKEAQAGVFRFRNNTWKL